MSIIVEEKHCRIKGTNLAALRTASSRQYDSTAHWQHLSPQDSSWIRCLHKHNCRLNRMSFRTKLRWRPNVLSSAFIEWLREQKDAGKRWPVKLLWASNGKKHVCGVETIIVEQISRTLIGSKMSHGTQQWKKNLRATLLQIVVLNVWSLYVPSRTKKREKPKTWMLNFSAAICKTTLRRLF